MIHSSAVGIAAGLLALVLGAAVPRGAAAQDTAAVVPAAPAGDTTTVAAPTPAPDTTRAAAAVPRDTVIVVDQVVAVVGNRPVLASQVDEELLVQQAARDTAIQVTDQEVADGVEQQVRKVPGSWSSKGRQLPNGFTWFSL